MSARPFLVIRVQIDPAVLEEFERWYRQEHLHNMLSLPGVVGAYRLNTARSGANWVAIFKFASEEALQESFNSAEATRARQAWQRWLPYISEISVEVYTSLGTMPPYHHWN